MASRDDSLDTEKEEKSVKGQRTGLEAYVARAAVLIISKRSIKID